MKLVKNFVFAVLFLSTITVKISAGEQDTPGYVPPPPHVITATTDEDTSKLLGDPNAERFGGTTAETSDYLLFEALAALLSVY